MMESPVQENNTQSEGTVIKPYAIEEPEDEPTDQAKDQCLQSLPDQFERWHVDLVDTMDDIRCESDNNERASSEDKRGQKRKPGNASSGPSQSNANSHSASSPPAAKAGNTRSDGPSLSPERLHRRNKRSKGGPPPLQDASSETSNATDSYCSASSAAQSTESSGTEMGNSDSPPATDQMDID